MQGSIETRVGIFVLIALAILAYMGFQIGAFRFDKARYNMYNVNFRDISGLSRKAEVKIAGVKVGWVEAIRLIANADIEAEASIYILNQYNLYQNAYAIVRQDGLLGPKYLEIIPGDPELERLVPHSTLSKPSVSPVSVDDLMHKFKTIAANVEDVSESLKWAIGGDEGKDELRSIFKNIDSATENLASFAQVLQHAFTSNEENIEAIMEIGTTIRRLATHLENDILPSFKEGVERISLVFDRDFNRIANKLESTAAALEEASLQVRDGFKSATSIADKIDEGQGLLGKLINEDETYEDIKVAAEGLRNYFAKIDKLQIVFDTHFETMLRPAENYDFEDSKGYFDVRVHPAEDYFFLLQIVGSEKGFVDRYEIVPSYIDCDGTYIDTKNLELTDAQRLENVFVRKRDIFTRGAVRFGLQLGKIFGDVALRLGMFENSIGGALDIDVPLYCEKLRWVTSFEAFDFRGWNRRDDRRPHLKWLNRMFFMRNLYFAFGADDFISKRNANIFFGAGLRFGDDEVKYLLSSFASGAAGVAGGGLGQVICVN